MRRQLVMAFAAAALILPSASALAHHEEEHSGGNGGNSQECPEESQNPGGTAPNCGSQDIDEDGVPNNEDNCPSVSNEDQKDENGFEDGEGAGDACEQAPPVQTECNDGADNDGDGLADSADADDCQGEDTTENTNAGGGGDPVGSCGEGGLAGATIANQAAGTQNEQGPISSQLHAGEEQAPAELQPVVHEVSCLIATVDNSIPAPPAVR